jgi:hypothetical protein
MQNANAAIALAKPPKPRNSPPAVPVEEQGAKKAPDVCRGFKVMGI